MNNELDTTTLESFYAQQLHALAVAIYQAKQRDDLADATALLSRFRTLAAEYAKLDNWNPSPAFQWADRAATEIAARAKALGTAVADLTQQTVESTTKLVKATGDAAGGLASILPLTVLALVLLGGYLIVTGKGSPGNWL